MAVDSDIRHSSLSILFDTEDHDDKVSDKLVEQIDAFFESLNIDDTPAANATDKSFKASEEVMLGELLSVVDTDNRFVYQGSMTTPPCTPKVYWNVISIVYPIKPAHLE